MQPDPQSRALARATSMGIPDVDNDPNTKDPAGAQYAMRTDDLPESDNIDDRRDGNYDDTVTPENMVNLRPDGANREPGLGGMFAADDNGGGVDDVDEYADGGEVDGEDDEEVTEPVTDGAIPDDGEAAPLDDTEAAQQQEGGDDWRGAAMEGINAGLAHGYDNVHAVNRPMSDDTHEDSVRAMLSGEGATPPDQYDAALRAVDPDGALDPASKQVKVLGDLYKFYGGGDKGAEAVWGGLQHQRKQFNALAAYAAVALDRGAFESGAKTAESAFNVVPDGLLTRIKAALFNGPSEELPGGGTFDRKKLEGEAGVNDIGKEDAMTAPDGKTRITKNDTAFGTSNGGGVKFHVEQIDPESKKMILSKDLTLDQLKAALASPGAFDRMAHGGTTTHIGRSASEDLRMQADPDYQRGQAAANRIDKPSPGYDAHGAKLPPEKTFGQRVADANGLEGMDMNGRTVSEIGRLRSQNDMARIKGGGAERLARINNESRERTAAGTQAGARERAQMTNAAAERRARIAAGVDPDTGQRSGDLTGRAAQNNANDNRIIEGRVKDAVARMGKPPTEDEIDQLRERARAGYYHEQGRQPPGQQQQQQPAAQSGQADQRRKMLSGEPVMNKADGKYYRYNPATRHMDPV